MRLVSSYSFVLCHLLGNPLDFLWSHLERLQRMRAFRRAVPGRYGDNVVVVCIALDDFEQDVTHSRLLRRLAFLEQTNQLAELEDLLGKCRIAGGQLRESRVSSTRRSVIAVMAYAIALFTTLSSNLAQKSVAVHTPHTIALRELYYWLVTAVALSSAVGAFPTEKTAAKTLKPVVEALDGLDEVRRRGYVLPPLSLAKGGSQGHCPQKRASVRSLPLIATATLSVTGAWAFSFVMSWVTPTAGLGCRSFMEIGFFCAWVLNFLISYGVSRRSKGTWPSALFLCDLIIAVPTVLCLFLAFRGWFNSCQCWAAAWTLPKPLHYFIPTNLQLQEVHLVATYYGIIAGALGLQALISAGVLLHFRHELRLIYGETEGASDIKSEEQLSSIHVEVHHSTKKSQVIGRESDVQGARQDVEQYELRDLGQRAQSERTVFLAVL